MLYLSIFKLGGVVTTVNTSYRERELEHQLIDCKATIIFTTPKLLPIVKSVAQKVGLKYIFTTSDVQDKLAIPLKSLLEKQSSTLINVDIHPDDVCILPYSSGTTGLPKGVMLTNKNLVANIQQIHEHENFDSSNSFVTFLPFFHIYGITIITLYGLYTGTYMFPMESYDFEKYLHYVSEKKKSFCSSCSSSSLHQSRKTSSC